MHTTVLLELSLLRVTVAGASGDHHPTLAFPKELSSTTATGLSLGTLALPSICRPQLFPMIPPFKTIIAWDLLNSKV